MKLYKEAITLNRNSRGCYILDTVKGCPGAALHGGRGCYGDCYAKNIAGRYGFDFEKVRARKFENEANQLHLFGLTDKTHTNQIIREIRAANMPFIRIGEMGDPSADWEHTVNVCREVAPAGKKIIIITKHWKPLPDALMEDFARMGLCVNTSVSALDNESELEYRLGQFERLKEVCKSVLRIVSCDFNTDHPDGLDRHLIQEELFKMGDHIDTIFRPSGNNVFVKKGIIKTENVRFLKKEVLASVYNKKTYLGECQYCPDMCGVDHA